MGDLVADFQKSSTPGSENYGKHMSPEEIIEFFAPHEDSTNAVTEWLVSSGISSDRFALSANKQVLLLILSDPVTIVNDCLKVDPIRCDYSRS
jgi:subtilase family serine protease